MMANTGVSYQDISYVLDFMYNGEVNVADNEHHIETYLHLKIYDENLAVVSATGPILIPTFVIHSSIQLV